MKRRTSTVKLLNEREKAKTINYLEQLVVPQLSALLGRLSSAHFQGFTQKEKVHLDDE